MPYRIKRKESVQAATRRIATEQIDKALREIDDAFSDRIGADWSLWREDSNSLGR